MCKPLRRSLRSSLRTLAVLTSFSLGTATTAVAQISIGQSDLLGMIGNSVVMHSDTTLSVTVNVGSSGENQTWDLSGLAIQGEFQTRLYVDPGATPFAADFPGANFATFITTDLQPGFELYQYGVVTPSSYQDLGAKVNVGDTAVVSFDSNQAIPLPVTFNSTWQEASTDTVQGPGFMTVVSDESTLLVDGWGRVVVPAGAFDALRIRSDNAVVSSIYVNDVLLQSDTTRSIGFQWVSEGSIAVANATSQDDEVNPSFTDAIHVEVATSFSVGVHDVERPVARPLIRATYPNPFSDEIAIEVSPYVGSTSATVHDILGRRIRSLSTGTADAGATTIVWDGRTNSGARATNGVYFIRVQQGDQVDTRKVVVAR